MSSEGTKFSSSTDSAPGSSKIEATFDVGARSAGNRPIVMMLASATNINAEFSANPSAIDMSPSNKATTIAFNGTRYMLYMVPRTCSGTTSLFKLPMEGKYMPTQNSKRMKENTLSPRCSSDFDSAARAATAKQRKLAAKDAMSLEATVDLGAISVDADAPHMQDIMKSAKITPCGGGTVSLSRAGVQLKTKANMEPSNAETTMPTSTARVSLRRTARALLMLCNMPSASWPSMALDSCGPGPP
mmetsp:Transcript_69995/g.193801  ORF Transcript_69995/g.193801 Transcript_69995/m.193801 type:complete len:244 (-) Transcript_69995:80-811(-)